MTPRVVPRGSPSLALTPSDFKGHTSRASLAASSSSSLYGTLLLPLPLLLLSPSIPPQGTSGAPGTHNRGVPGVRAFLELSAPATAKWVLRLVSYYALLRIGVAKGRPPVCCAFVVVQGGG